MLDSNARTFHFATGGAQSWLGNARALAAPAKEATLIAAPPNL